MNREVLNRLLCDAFRDGLNKGINLGKDIGRFYEKNNIVDNVSIPAELLEELSKIYDKHISETKVSGELIWENILNGSW